MRQILLVTSFMVIVMLGGCTVSPSVLGDNNIVGIGSEPAADSPATIIPPDSGTSSTVPPPTAAGATVGSPDSTGSIVPLQEEGAIVDLPDSSARMQASSSYQQGEQSQSVEEGEPASAGEQAFSPEERHRRELINRGDLQEGQLLPVE